MSSQSVVEEGNMRKWALVVAVVLSLATIFLTGCSEASGPQTRKVPPPEKARAALDDYLKEKTGKSEFKTSFDAVKHKNPWTDLKVVYDTPPDYKAVYRSIGEHLFIADGLINNSDTNQHWKGIYIAMELCDIADDVAYDEWLSARICDAYLVPNIEKMEEKPKRGPSREQFVQYIARVYRNAEEPDRLIDLGKLLLAQAGNGRRADGIRWRLARELENRGEHKEAARYLREITEPSLTNEVSKRLAVVEQNIKQSKK